MLSSCRVSGKLPTCTHSPDTHTTSRVLAGDFQHSESLTSSILKSGTYSGIGFVWKFVIYGLLYFDLFYEAVKISDF